LTVPADPQAPAVSIVIPVLDEADGLAELHRRVRAALTRTEHEIIYVDDGSTDGSTALIEGWAASEAGVTLVKLSRNFGMELAMTAGLDHARGAHVVLMHADLQDPPELIPKMIGAWREGADVVYAVRRERNGETRLKLATARWFYRVFGRLAQIEFEQDAGDFRLFDRSALDALGSMRERSRFLRGMSVWVGFTQTAIPYERDARHAGETKFSARRMLRFSFDALTSFSNVPLQAAMLLGFTFSLVAFLGIPVAIAMKIGGMYVSGIATVLLAVLLLGGVQLIAIGVIGEYLGRVYDEVKRRPLYVVRDRVNMVAAEPEPELDRSAEPQPR
jgi:glycosyltransferase involved in cell wall biosynthesis